jgi:hypothetical protein
VCALDERARLPRDVLHHRVRLRALVAADVHDVAHALGRHHPGARSAVLEDRVGGDGRAMQHAVDRVGIDPAALAQLDDAGHQSPARIVGRRTHLVHDDRVARGVIEGEVGERPADVDANQFHLRPHSFM